MNDKTVTFIFQSLQQLRDVYGDAVDKFVQNNRVLLESK
jgi:hypothetical protein